VGDKLVVPPASADKKSVYGSGVDGRVVVYDDILKFA
jgi:hypothetical protein